MITERYAHSTSYYVRPSSARLAITRDHGNIRDVNSRCSLLIVRATATSKHVKPSRPFKLSESSHVTIGRVSHQNLASIVSLAKADICL